MLLQLIIPRDWLLSLDALTVVSGRRTTVMMTLLTLGFLACLRGVAPRDNADGAAGAPSGSPGGGAGTVASQAAKPTLDPGHAEVRFAGGHVVLAEIADTPESVARGYMYRTKVGKSDGMLFVFPYPDVHPFWMKNTLVPLDIIWMDETFAVLHIQPSAPPCKTDLCPSYGPLRKAAYVLEVRGGTAAKEGLKVGDRLAIVLPGGPGGGS